MKRNDGPSEFCAADLDRAREAGRQEFAREMRTLALRLEPRDGAMVQLLVDEAERPRHDVQRIDLVAPPDAASQFVAEVWNNGDGVIRSSFESWTQAQQRGCGEQMSIEVRCGDVAWGRRFLCISCRPAAKSEPQKT